MTFEILNTHLNYLFVYMGTAVFAGLLNTGSSRWIQKNHFPECLPLESTPRNASGKLFYNRADVLSWTSRSSIFAASTITGFERLALPNPIHLSRPCPGNGIAPLAPAPRSGASSALAGTVNWSPTMHCSTDSFDYLFAHPTESKQQVLRRCLSGQ